MKDKRAELSVLLRISTPEKSEILKEAKIKKLGLETDIEMDNDFFREHVFCLKKFYFEQNDGHLKTEFFKARIDFVSAVGHPVWDCLWEDKACIYMWRERNLVFREIFTDENSEEFILVFKFKDEDWTFGFYKLSEYQFSDKDRAVCLVL